MDDAGAKRRRKRKPKTTIEEDCMTCSACHSKLVKVSDITKISLDALKVIGKGNELSCTVCGSTLRALDGLIG
ncbi:Zn finger-like protein, late morphogenesis [Eptesipox virus]|uniref:Zn finger-like protein, late morphogenesis n=1 Tax=Eptesipox virus TaxID=1329402 RepID=A0A220T6I4_9POXV|nr:Zn finger-like protein, late morphogenesis [Eptesipox virus]ASK51317.1 Zn finger-like protein, late morphogenesis [Eptesipox virus]WAH71075.1 Zn finger-like protein, late morphogenesis [Eptesipox virus]